MEKILVSIVAPTWESRQAYNDVLDGVTDIHVMAMSADLSGQATWMAMAHSDVVIVDEAVIEEEGYAALEMLLESYTGVKCLVVMRGFHRDRMVWVILRGVRGVMCADEVRRLLTRAIRQLYAGEVWVPRGLVGPIRYAFLSDPARAQVRLRFDKPGEWHKYH